MSVTRHFEQFNTHRLVWRLVLCICFRLPFELECDAVRAVGELWVRKAEMLEVQF